MKRLTILFLLLLSSVYADIGEITAVNGKAILIRDKVEIPIKQHIKIEEKDIIKTMKNSKLQIIFKDQTVISLGQKTTFKIDEYLFSQTKPKAKFNISKGLFKSITGKIGKIAPQNFKLKTQNATIGVRGTTIIGEVSKDLDTIMCSSGKIIVTSFGSKVAVDMGEKTIVRRGYKPTAAVKVSKEVISKIDKDINPEKESLTIQEPVIANEKFDEVSEIKDQWGDWNKEDLISEDLEEEPNSPEEEQNEPQMLEALQDLRDRTGSSNPTYSGKVSGFVDTPFNQISKNNNHIDLNFDLGQGTMSGDIGFTAGSEQWNADIQNGTVDQRGQFDFGLENKTDTLNGSGNGMLSGKELQNADGSLQLQNETTNKQAFGTFHADKN
jgi:hypothetical protein